MDSEADKSQDALRPICERFENAIANGNKEEAVEMATRLLMLGVYFEVNPKGEPEMTVYEDFDIAFQNKKLEVVTELSKQDKKRRQKALVKMGFPQAIVFKVISQKLKDEMNDQLLAEYYRRKEKK